MDFLNYHQLHYFWMVARTGGVGAAASKLLVSQSTVSAQLRNLETALGVRLFERTGRRLVLNDVGQVAFEYAESIFTLGRELQDALQSGEASGRGKIAVGLSSAVPDQVAWDVLRPVLTLDPPARLVVRRGGLETLLNDVASHQLDLVLSDRPDWDNGGARALIHEVDAREVLFAAPSERAFELRSDFPASLSSAAVALPVGGTSLRRLLDRWFEQHGLQPRVVAEFEDPGLLEVAAVADGVAVPLVEGTVAQVVGGVGLEIIGRVDGCVARFYAISAERRTRNRAMVAMTGLARGRLQKHRFSVAAPATGGDGDHDDYDEGREGPRLAA